MHWLNNPMNGKLAVVYFGSWGGKTVNHAVDGIVGKIFKKVLALKFSVTGKASWGAAKKLSLKSTPLFPIVVRFVKSSKQTREATENEIEKRIATFLRTSRDKEGGREERRQQQS